MSERSIFIAAMEKDDATERAAYLDKACADLQLELLRREPVHPRIDCTQSSAAGGVLTAKQAPPPASAPLRAARSRAPAKVSFSLYRRPALERRNIMWFSSSLRNSKRSAPKAARRTHTSPRQRARFHPRIEAIEDRCLLSTTIVQTNLISDNTQATPAQVQDPNPGQLPGDWPRVQPASGG